MPKAWTNIRYTAQWTDKQSGYMWKLVIQPSDTTDITPTDIDLPAHCIIDYKFGWEYPDDHPVGMMGLPYFNFTFQKEHCPESLVKMLASPYVDLAASYALDTETVNISFTAGNLFKVYIQYPDFDPGTWYLRYIGTQDEGHTYKYNKDDTIEVETISLLKCLSYITKDHLYYFYDYSPGSWNNEFFLVDYAHSYNGTNYLNYTQTMKYGGKIIKMWLASPNLLGSYLSALGDAVGKKVLRDSSAVNIFPSLTSNIYEGYYEQNYLGDGTQGSSIIAGNLMIPFYLANKYYTDKASATFIKGGGMDYINDEYPTALDLLSAIIKNEFQRCLIAGGATNDNKQDVTITTIYNSNYVNLNTADIIDLEFEIGLNTIKTSKTITLEKVDNDPGEFIAGTGTKNDNTNQIIVLLNNLPLIPETINHAQRNAKNIRFYKLHGLQLFYYDDLVNQGFVSNVWYSDDILVRVHERPDFKLEGTSKYLSDFVTIDDYEFADKAQAPDFVAAFNTYRKDVCYLSGKPLAIAKIFKYCFGDSYLTDLTGKTLHANGVTYDTSVRDSWFEPLYEFFIDLDPLEKYANEYDNISNRWILKKVELGKDGLVDFEMQSRRSSTI